MDRHLLGIFQGELRTQCEFIVIGARHVNAALNAGDTPGVWFGLQGILISASNASKLLWGSRKAPVVEARRSLRESVEVEESSPLNSRDLRNDFEHFDERLGDWFAGSIDRNYLGRNIGPPNMIVIGDSVPTDQFGHFDPSTATVSFWNRSADLNAIVAEAQRVLSHLNAIQ